MFELFRSKFFRKPVSHPANRRLVQALSQDLRSGYTRIAFGDLVNGWSLQVGQVPYDWHRDGSTLYRHGRALIANFESAQCSPQRDNPGAWVLQGILEGEPFRCSIHSSSLDRRWPYFRSVNHVLQYWHCCYVLEAQRHPDLGHADIIHLESIQDEVHGLHFGGFAQRLEESRYLIGCQLPQRQRSAGIWLDPTQPFRLADNQSDVFLDHVRGAIRSIPTGAASVRDYFWQFLVSEANCFASQHSTQWAVR